ncbi:hypothetical protein [Nocardia otitidiscaviarum]|uniref:hypothetical protein n=1 Tax=Nocardia otitidiscaviarum TaxID=1823 RepID=UPI0011DD90BA|nr:hypothetical protein [Nocardia otitidiscaviarum]
MAAKKNADGRVTAPFVTEINGVAITLPSLAYLRPGLIRRIRHEDELGQLFVLLEASLNDEEMAQIDSLEVDEFNALMSAWREHSGLSLGE